MTLEFTFILWHGTKITYLFICPAVSQIFVCVAPVPGRQLETKSGPLPSLLKLTAQQTHGSTPTNTRLHPNKRPQGKECGSVGVGSPGLGRGGY